MEEVNDMNIEFIVVSYTTFVRYMETNDESWLTQSTDGIVNQQHNQRMGQTQTLLFPMKYSMH